MAFQVSPGVRVTETDLTNIIPAVSTSVGAFVGKFRWGPVNQVTTLATESGLVETFGTPVVLTRKDADDSETRNSFQNQQDWYACANFLQYASALRVVRVVDANAVNASEGTVATDATESIIFRASFTDSTDVGSLDGTYAGSRGSDLNLRLEGVFDFTQDAAWESDDLVVESADLESDDPLVRVLQSLRSDLDAVLLRSADAFSYPSTNTNGMGNIIHTNRGRSSATATLTITGVARNVFESTTITDSDLNLTLEIVREVLASDVDSDSNVLIENAAHFAEKEQDREFANTAFFHAKYPGLYGNNIGVSIIDAGVGDSGWASSTGGAKYLNAGTSSQFRFSDLFDTIPRTSVYADRHNASLDELHVVIYDRTGQITGSVGTVLETFGYVSKATDATTIDGAPNYYREVVNSQSQYVWIARDFPATLGNNDVRFPQLDSDYTHLAGINLSSLTNPTGEFAIFVANSAGGTPAYVRVDLFNATGGVDAQNEVDVTNGGNGMRTGGWDLFADPEAQADVSIFFASLAGGPVAETATALAAKKYMIDIADTRKDVVAVISPRYQDAVTTPTATKIVQYFNNTDRTDGVGYNSTSYAVFTSGWKYQYDRYNDLFFWMPTDPDVAGLMARTDATNAPWFSPAGLNRGQIRDVVRLSFNPNQADRDDLYQARVNPITTFPGEGTILFGDKTALSRPSAFDRINVRRLFIVLEKAIATSARFQLFELNDEFTRASFVNAVEPFLRDVQAQRGIEEFRVIADTSVNTPEVISGNEFRANIFIRPTYSINFITLNFVAVRGGVSFDEIAGVVA